MNKNFIVAFFLIVFGNFSIMVLEAIVFNKAAIVDLAINHNYNTNYTLLMQKVSIWFCTLFIISTIIFKIKQKWKVQVKYLVALFYSVAFEVNSIITPHPFWIHFAILFIVSLPFIIEIVFNKSYSKIFKTIKYSFWGKYKKQLPNINYE